VKIEDAAEDASGNAPPVTRDQGDSDDSLSISRDLQSQEYWRTVVEDILKYTGDPNTQQLIHDRVVAYLDDIERRSSRPRFRTR
jgi:hypothetical protein